MALIMPDSECKICGERLGDDFDNVIGFTSLSVAYEQPDFSDFSDAACHRTCLSSWDRRDEFIECWNAELKKLDRPTIDQLFVDDGLVRYREVENEDYKEEEIEEPTVEPPEPVREVDPDQLAAMEKNFHEVIRGRVARLLENHEHQMPSLQALLDADKDDAWFPVLGMVGGFHYWFERRAGRPVLVSESWSRIEWGSGQRHEITAEGSRLVEEGFC